MSQSLQQRLRLYADCHRHPVNRAIHLVAVPLIVFHALAMLDWVEIARLPMAGGLRLTPAHLLIAGAGLWYLRAAPRLAPIVLVWSLACLVAGWYAPRWLVAAVALLAWSAQFAGHALFEKNRPAFLENALQLLVGPLYVAALASGAWPQSAPSGLLAEHDAATRAVERMRSLSTRAAEPAEGDESSTGFAPQGPEREVLLAKLLGETPRWYSPWAHLLLPASFALACMALALARIEDLRPLELLTVPVTWVWANFVEWHAHRDLLHTRRRWMPVAYERHVLTHHRLYASERMGLCDWAEFRQILLPAYAIPLLALMIVPLAGALWLIAGRNVGLLYAFTGIGYVVSYEWLHLSYHLPEASWIGRRRLVRVLRRHHQTHHDPRIMRRFNLNVSVPLWDWVRGTIARPEPAQAELDREPERRHGEDAARPAALEP